MAVERSVGWRFSGARTVSVLFGVYAVFWAQFWPVRSINFGGIDEWMILSLATRGVVDIPYANRPLGLLFSLPVALFPAQLLNASLLLHAHYLVAAGLLTSLLVLHLLPGRPELAFLAGVFAACWAPSDLMRLDPVYSAAYSGATAGVALVILLLARAGHSIGGVAIAAGLAFVITRVHEAPLPVLLLAPLLLWGLGRRLPRGSVVAYSCATGLAALVAALPLLQGRAPAWYQSQVLGLYLDPVGLAGRLALQFRLHLEPLVTLHLGVPQPTTILAMGLLVAGLVVLRSDADPSASPPDRRRLAAFVAAGLLGTAAAYSSFILAAKLPGSLRTEFIAAPWLGLALAAAIVLLAELAPRAGRLAVLAGLGALVAGVGASRTAALQATWDAIGRYPRQAAALSQITARAPGLAPGTLVVVVGADDIWIGSYALHHGLQLVYGRHVAGCMLNPREPLFYECQLGPDGLRLVPWRVLQQAWHEPARLYRFQDIVVLRVASAHRIMLLDSWPGELGAIPPGARYEPAARLVAASPPPTRRGFPGF